MARAYRIRTIGKAVASIAIASGVALGLTACGTSGAPGTAFIVNGDSVSETALTDAITQWAQLSGTEIPRDEMVGFLVETNLRLQAADAVGIELPDEEIQATLEGAIAQLGSDLDVADVDPTVRDMFKDLLLVNVVRSGAISNEQIVELDAFIMDSDVTLNPRYGTFTDGSIVGPGDLPGSVTGNLLETGTAG